MGRGTLDSVSPLLAHAWAGRGEGRREIRRGHSREKTPLRDLSCAYRSGLVVLPTIPKENARTESPGREHDAMERNVLQIRSRSGVGQAPDAAPLHAIHRK